MGGYNSGGGRHASKCDAMSRLELPWLRANDYLRPGRLGTVSWTWNGKPSGRIGVLALHDGVELRYTKNGEPIQERIFFAEVRGGFGARLLFCCPSCNRACSVLYGGKYFRCRRCFRLVYASQYEALWERARTKAEHIRKRLTGKSTHLVIGDFNPFPPRPKGMHRSTYRRLQALDKRLLAMAERAFNAEVSQRFGIFAA